MGNRPGERPAKKSRAALKCAFAALLRAKGYGDVSVGEIARRADVGRSTFYRHFNGKADLLVALHEDIFRELFVDSADAYQWTGAEPPERLRAFFSGHRPSGAASLSTLAASGVDADYIMRGVLEILARSVEEGLRKSFSGRRPGIPFPVLAKSIAGVFMMAIAPVKRERTVEKGADVDALHALIRAMTLEAFGQKAK